MLRIGFLLVGLGSALLASPALAKELSKEEMQETSIAEMKLQIEALQRRLNELEAPHRNVGRSDDAAEERLVRAAPIPVVTPSAAAIEPGRATVPGLLPPEPMGTQFEDALRSDLPGLSIRMPGTASEVRFYGFAKASGYGDFDGRNQTDVPTVQTIPLDDSAADFQGGDFGMTARFSRFGMDTRTLTNLGTLETRFEGDFGGGAPATNNAVFRLRQAWGELGTDEFRVLIGQANSLWNEGMFETLIDSTNLNQSFVRQPQIRATGKLAPSLTGYVSLETPETQYTSVDGIFTPTSSVEGGLSPAFNSMPDLLGRLEYSNAGWGFDMRGLLRDLTIRTAGTAVAPPALTKDTAGWGLAASATVPMRALSGFFGPDQLIGMAYYGEGIGRYFGGNTFGQDALSNIGLPGTLTTFNFDALPTHGVTAAYRRFWTTKLRSNLAYSFAWQDYPSYALGFNPGSASATSLNSEMQQGIVNLIWSPFAQLRDGVVGTGWLDVGIEYIYSDRDVFGGSESTAEAGNGHGTANRVMAAAIARY